MLLFTQLRSALAKHFTHENLWKPSVIAMEQSPCWFAGLMIEPSDFSQQLSNLQTSLRRANAPVPNGNATPVAISRGEDRL